MKQINIAISDVLLTIIAPKENIFLFSDRQRKRKINPAESEGKTLKNKQFLRQNFHGSIY